MSNIVCICNTYTQLIMALQIKQTLKKEDNVILLLSDHSKNAEMVVRNLKKQNIFFEVSLLECRQGDYENKPLSKSLLYALKCCCGKLPINCNAIIDLYIDEIIFFNYSLSVINVYDIVSKLNKNLVCSRYEEGIISYSNVASDSSKNNSKRMKIVELIRKLLGKRNPIDTIDNFYCFYPDFYDGKGTTIQVPLILGESFKNIISTAFGIESSLLNYPCKYIFFASVGDFEGEHPVGEVDIALQIARIVGNENLLIKVHPRDRTDSFLKAGLNVDINSSAPWEVIQLNYDFSKYVFLTVSSSSVFGVNLMLENRARVFFLYKFCDVTRNSLISKSVDLINHILSSSEKVDLSNYFVAEKLEDILIY